MLPGSTICLLLLVICFRTLTANFTRFIIILVSCCFAFRFESLSLLVFCFVSCVVGVFIYGANLFGGFT